MNPAALVAERRAIPGPGSYDVSKQSSRNTKSFSVRHKLPNEKLLEARDARDGPGPAALAIACYNTQHATKYVSRTQSQNESRSCPVGKAWSFGKDGRRVNEEAIRHGREVPSPNRYRPNDTMIKEKPLTYTLGQRLKDIFMPNYKHGPQALWAKGRRRASLDEHDRFCRGQLSHHRTASETDHRENLETNATQIYRSDANRSRARTPGHKGIMDVPSIVVTDQFATSFVEDSVQDPNGIRAAGRTIGDLDSSNPGC